MTGSPSARSPCRTIPTPPGFVGRLARQLALLAGQRARDPAVISVLTELTELTGLAAGLFKALTESLSPPGPGTS